MSERILFWIAIAGFALALVGVGVAFAVSNHPDRAKAAKLFFFLAAIVFAVGISYWTISTSQKLAVRIAVDLLSMSLIAAGLFGGFRFADRGLLTELKIPSSAFVREPLWPQNKKSTLVTTIGILALIALLNGSREPDPIGTLFWPLTVLLYNLYDFPLRLVVMVGINVPALIVIYWLSVRRQKRIECVEPRLHDLAKQDAIRIKDLVRVTAIHYRPEFDKGSPYIDFIFDLFNISLFDIAVDNSIKKGSILFGEDNEKFYYQPKLEGENIGCRSRSGNYFVVRQAVRAEEITRFRKAKNLLVAFHGLEIAFHGTDQFPEIGSTSLNTHYYLETEKRIWRYIASDEDQSAFAYTDEQWAELTAKRVPTETEAKAEIESLRAENRSLSAKVSGLTAALDRMPRAMGSRQPGRTTRSSNPIFVDVSIDYLMNLFVGHTEAEGQRLIAPYRGKWLRHTGSVINVHEYGDRTEVCMRVQVKGFPGIATMFINGYDRAWMDRASVLKIGDEVAIEGEIESVSASIAFISEAAFIEKGNESP